MKTRLFKWLGTCAVLLLSISVFAQNQQREITGRVVDEGGLPLPGVSIQVKDGNRSSGTNADGTYQIQVPDAEGTVLVYSFVGMKSQEITLGSQNEVNVVMELEAMNLDEVVAIGYGTIRKKDLTGSVAVIEGADLQKRNEVVLSQALQGAAPGVSVTRSSGLPGALGTIRVRGITTIGDSDPLVLVDGIPVVSIDRVNPNDVESISVLKDASSASIYGARAAAGVILITTKRAKVNELKLDYQGLYGMITPTEFPGTVDHIRYMEMINEVAWNDGGNQDGAQYNVYSKDFIADYDANHNLTDPYLFPIMNWKDELLKDFASNTAHGVSLTYGNDFVKTKASLNYEKANALYKNRSFERISTRVNNEFKITDFLSADIGGSYLRSQNLQPILNPISHVYKHGPLETPYWPDGRVSSGRNGTNTWARINYGGFNDNWGDELTGRFALNYTPIKNLTISGVVAPSIRSVKGKNFVKQIPYYDYKDIERSTGFVSGNLITTLAEARSEIRTMTKQLTANYNTTLNTDHNLSLMIGYEDYYQFQEGLNASSSELSLSSYPYLDRANLDFISADGNAIEHAYNSYFGRVMYDYAGRYLLQANIRYDGSSRFHKDYRWASFPSVSVGWVPTEESFIQDLNLEKLDFFKLRGSWGTLGNERIGNYPYQAIMNFNNTLFVEDGNIVSRTTAAQVGYNIRDISWETTESWNIGLDARMFSSRLSLTADYYQKTTKDMLLALEIPAFMGYDNPDQNAGTMNTKGWELQIGWRDHIGELSYSVSANISDYKSVMGNLSGVVFLGNQIIREGVEYNSWYGYRSSGLFQSQDEIDNSALLSKVVRPGDVKYQDISGPDGVPDGVINPEYDRVPLAGSLPRYIYGGNINLGYKGFDLYMMFQGVGKQTSRLTADMVYQTAAWYNFPNFVDGNYYSAYNSEAQNREARFPRLSQLGYDGNNFENSDFWLFDGSYFRLKNVTLGYTFPSKWLDPIKMKKLRVYASVNDLFSLDQFPKGWDPEAGTTAYIARTWNFGLQLSF